MCCEHKKKADSTSHEHMQELSVQVEIRFEHSLVNCGGFFMSVCFVLYLSGTGHVAHYLSHSIPCHVADETVLLLFILSVSVAEEVLCSGHDHQGLVHLNDVFYLPVDKLFEHLFTDCKFQRDFLAFRKTYGECE